MCLCVCLITRAAWHMCSGPEERSRYSDSLRAERFRQSNPGGAKFPHPSRPVLEFLYIGYRVTPGGKGAGAWRSPPTPSRAEVKEKVELLLYSPSGPSWTILGWTLPAWHTCIRHTPQRSIGLLSSETPRRSSLFPSSTQFLQVISPFL